MKPGYETSMKPPNPAATHETALGTTWGDEAFGTIGFVFTWLSRAHGDWAWARM